MYVEPSVLLWLAVLSVTAEADSPASFVLPADQGTAVFRQCSRPTPIGAEGFWMPSPKDIGELEGALAPYLKTTLLGKELLPLSLFHRQYVGFIRRKEKYIYGNFYPTWLLDKRGERKLDESRYVVNVCDGGPDFWGIVYSLEGKSFQELEHNGEY